MSRAEILHLYWSEFFRSIDGIPVRQLGDDHLVWFAEAVIAKALERQGSGWISVEERLPEHGENVLFVTSTGHWLGWRDKETGKWLDHFDDTSVCNDDDVTHWMPLPPAPQAQDAQTGLTFAERCERQSPDSLNEPPQAGQEALARAFSGGAKFPAAPSQEGHAAGPASGSPDIAALVGRLEGYIWSHGTIQVIGDAISKLIEMDTDRARVLAAHKATMGAADEREEALQGQLTRTREVLKETLDIASRGPTLTSVRCPMCASGTKIAGMGESGFTMHGAKATCWSCSHTWDTTPESHKRLAAIRKEINTEDGK